MMINRSKIILKIEEINCKVALWYQIQTWTFNFKALWFQIASKCHYTALVNILIRFSEAAKMQTRIGKTELHITQIKQQQ